jgi:hypothetical protein
MCRHECNTHNFLFNLENQTMDFSYTIFPVKKNKCGENFKIMKKLLFIHILKLEISGCDSRPVVAGRSGSIWPPPPSPAAARRGKQMRRGEDFGA